MESSYALHGHARTLATIMPITLDIREWSASSPPRLPGDPMMDILDEPSIPLPPSVSGSEENGELDRPVAEPVLQTGERDARYHIAEKDAHLMEHEGQEPLAPEEVDLIMEDAQSLEPQPLNDGQGGGPDHNSSDTADGLLDIPITDVEGPEDASELDMPFLEFINLVRLDAYERHRNVALQNAVSELLQECGTYGRLLPVQSILFRRLVDCFKSDKKAAFAAFYEQRLRSQSVSISNPSTFVPGGHSRNRSSGPSIASRTSPWISALSLGGQGAMIRFLDRIRCDCSFLANHLANLSPSQITSLVKPHRQSAVTESVLDQALPYSKFDPRNFNRTRPRTADSPLKPDTLSQDPLFLLIHCVFDPVSQWGSRERRRQLDVWSSVCARIIEDGRPGSDEFCLTVLDAFADMRPWTLKPELELYLMDLISAGQFVTDSQASFGADLSLPAELHNARMAVATSEYFEKALNTLIDLVTKDPLGAGVPTAALDLVHATLRKISNPGRRHKARSFFVSRWYCASFLSNALLFPERTKMLLGTHVSSTVRHKILRELAVRFQRVVFEALSPQYVKDLSSTASMIPLLNLRSSSFSNLVPHPADKAVEKLVMIFEPSDNQGDLQATQSEVCPFDRPFLMLFAQDVLSIAKALSAEEPMESKGDFIVNKTLSIASSFTGSSTLTAGTNGQNTGTASSLAPSISGTSVTSNTLSNDLFMTGWDKSVQGTRTLEIPSRSRPSTSGDQFSAVKQDHIQLFLPELSNLVSMRSSLRSGAEGGAMFYISNSNGGLRLDPLELGVEITDQPAPPEGMDISISRESEDLMKAISQALLDNDTAYRNRTSDSSDVFESIQTLFQERMADCRSRHDFQPAYFWHRTLQNLSQVTVGAKSSTVHKTIGRYKERIRVNVSKSTSYQEWLFGLQTVQRRITQGFQQQSSCSEALRDKMWFVADVRHSSTYEQTLHVVRALKNMAAPPQPRQTGVAAWARQRFKTSFGQERAQAQVFEVLAASQEHGGPNKLSDNQAEVTSRWLTQDSIENFCKSEERFHRFCLEIQKCAKRLVGETMLESPVLWSSILYQQEKQELKPRTQSSSPSFPLQTTTSKAKLDFSDPGGRSPQNPKLSYQSQSLARNPGLGFTFGNQLAQTPPTQQFGNFQDGLQNTAISSPSGYAGYQPMPPPTWILPPSPISPDMMGMGIAELAEIPKGASVFVDKLRQTVISLLLSDLGQPLWAKGSETDLWLNDNRTPIVPNSQPAEALLIGLAQDPAQGQTGLANEANAGSSVQDTGAMSSTNDERLDDCQARGKSRETSFGKSALPLGFPFMEGYEKLLKRFQFSCDPQVKLQALYELTVLAESHDLSCELAANGSVPLTENDTSFARTSREHKIYGMGVPRTRLTRLEEVTANCEERRLTSLEAPTQTGSMLRSTSVAANYQALPSELTRAMKIIRCLLSDKAYRPSTLFRDLQMIASFVPSSTLDHTPKGTAFWTIGLAAMALKSETCRMMTGRAAEILSFHLSNGNKKEPTRADQQQQRLHSPERQQAQSSRDRPPPLTPSELANTSLEDAARLYTLSAMEGDPTAARELGLFYLTHPELVRRVTLPLSKPSEVFRSSLALGVVGGGERSGGGGTGGGNGSDKGGALDPPTFAVAFHWMEFAANAGDADARTFLRENGDLGRGW